ncbi:MAG: CDP-alcohol phosphatidyltransferase family protein [Pseudomonadota bacterium]|nr:CDP-alcohol phosphatidyltransferase family protein [Pseudomonadota bacterium]
MNVPNLISLIRLLAVPFMIYLILNGFYFSAFWLFVAAGISDGIDGFIAKRLEQVTPLGAYLDPLADKALLVAVYISLGKMDCLPSWLVILVVFRDVIIIGGVVLLHLLTDGVKMQPIFVSKINTLIQIILVIAVLFQLAFNFSNLEQIITALIFLVTVTTIFSGGVYIINWGKKVDRKNGANEL